MYRARSVSAAGLAVVLLGAGLIHAATKTRVITTKAAGPIRLGMTVAQARKASPGWSFTRTSDGEGMALIAVRGGKKDLMQLYAGEDNPGGRVSERKRIEHIEVTSPLFATAAGVTPGMSIRDAEKRYGKIREITLTEIEAREYVRFARGPAGITFRVTAPDGFAGVYPENAGPPAKTTRITPKARIASIIIAGG
jgi:hypothetical protein